MARLEGKVALITGAARGQGEADARLFAAEGASVIVTDVLDDLGRSVSESIGSRASFLHLDVSDESRWKQVTEQVLKQHGRLDVLVNNAGISGPHTDLIQTSMEDFQRAIGTNLIGVFLGMKSCAPLLGANGGGTIVNIASTSGIRGAKNRLVYTATKFAVRGMTQVAALELAPMGVRVNCVLPGVVDTDMIRRTPSGSPSSGLSRYVSRVPLRRIAEPVELARLVLFLASDQSSYCTGADFAADGGYLAN